MKKILVAALLMLCLSGCAEMEMHGSNLVASTVKIDRTIVLYSATGDTLKVWSGETYIVDGNGAGLTFMLNGKKIFVSGTITIEEN